MASFVDTFSDLQELGINVCESDDNLTNSFTRAADHLQTLLPNVDNQTLLTLYGYYKQGLEGACNVPKPSWYDIRSKAKWESWNKLGNMSQKQAKFLYIETIKALDHDFEDVPKEQWVKVSSMLPENISSSDLTIIDYIKKGDIAEVKRHLNNNETNVKNAINTLDEEGLALIHWAADAGNLDIMKVLIDAGSDIDLQDNDGQTPLHYAASCGHTNCVEYLLKRGAKIQVLDNDGNSPVDVSNDDDIKKLLLK